ncbi:zinc metalloproteinase nas-4-like [Paramacrobiotus metropolitanus]|uniref:zinc metalloproteinase nas-4-like n=1 Tax=Paramacrobiotus metropolitanus TaxID=2943436 RepID=UPI0024457B26|nr:zinc metalloproteinase nas-4-like [Paramacrobiotus metropolitanus]
MYEAASVSTQPAVLSVQCQLQISSRDFIKNLLVKVDDNTISDSAVKNGSQRQISEVRSTLNRDTKFGRWSSSRIPYRLDSSYTPFQRTAIREAMSQISSDVNNCVRFAEFDSRTDMGEDFLLITPTDDGTLQQTCFTSPGRDTTRGGLGQPLVMFPGTGGCMDSKRDIMKLLSNALGLRNEFSRPDRDNFILVQPQNVKSEFRTLDLFRKYQPSEVEYQNFPFDYLSITMYSQDRFAIEGTVAYNLINPGAFVGNLPRLSKGDCQGLTAHYGCSSLFCLDPYADAKDKSITADAASWNLDDLNNFSIAKDLFHKPSKPKASSRRPFLIRPIAIL